jgi:hypothetical protein
MNKKKLNGISFAIAVSENGMPDKNQTRVRYFPAEETDDQ